MENTANEYININEELADKLNGKCFLDFDEDRTIDAFKFIKTEQGLKSVVIGFGPDFGYKEELLDEYGIHSFYDSWLAYDIKRVLEESFDIRSITQDEFDNIERMVEESIIEREKRKKRFEGIKKKIMSKDDA